MNPTHGSEWMVQVLATNSELKGSCALAKEVELYRSRSFASAQEFFFDVRYRKDLNHPPRTSAGFHLGAFIAFESPAPVRSNCPRPIRTGAHL